MLYFRNIIQDPEYYKVFDSSMVPQFSAGDTVFCSKQKTAYIRYGEAYLIKHNSSVILRRVLKGNGPGMVLLKCNNPLYLDMEVPEKEIESLWLVKAKFQPMVQGGKMNNNPVSITYHS